MFTECRESSPDDPRHWCPDCRAELLESLLREHAARGRRGDLVGTGGRPAPAVISSHLHT
jgi:hypothetical protein